MPAPQKFLVRYFHPERVCYLDIAETSPPLLLDETVTELLRRDGKHYQLLTYYNERGDLWSAEFRLKDEFYALPVSPKEMTVDLRALAMESGINDLARVDLFSRIKVALGLGLDSPNSPPSNDSTPSDS